mmetsp:Transcript_2620/g.6591  ORF Transcript_2620/g.6591 Transcript_2620/m.6591 type:complete len:269 (+) Transcript_2620:1278-2084(+)
MCSASLGNVMSRGHPSSSARPCILSSRSFEITPPLWLERLLPSVPGVLGGGGGIPGVLAIVTRLARNTSPIGRLADSSTRTRRRSRTTSARSNSTTSPDWALSSSCFSCCCCCCAISSPLSVAGVAASMPPSPGAAAESSCAGVLPLSFSISESFCLPGSDVAFSISAASGAAGSATTAAAGAESSSRRSLMRFASTSTDSTTPRCQTLFLASCSPARRRTSTALPSSSALRASHGMTNRRGWCVPSSKRWRRRSSYVRSRYSGMSRS